MKEKATLKGIYTFTKAKLKTAYDFALNEKIGMYRDKGLDIRPLIKELHSICNTEVWQIENIIPTVGRTLIANNLTGITPTNDPLASHVALGDSSTAVANGDTTLTNETYRNAVASRTNVDNVAYITGFYTAAEVTGTFEEAGIFCDGTGTADTGVLLSHVLTGTITKTASDTLTIDWTLTIS